MPKEEWGVKRICPTTGKRFYDLNRDPIVSPYTGEEVKLDDTKSRLIQADGEDLSARRATESDAAEEDVVLDDDDMDMAGTKFNVLNHVLVPHQELVPVEDEEEVLEPWGLLAIDEDTGEPRLAKELLPKILITDPVVQVIKETVEREREANAEGDEEHVPLPAGWLSDRVLRVVRKSPSAGVSTAYRLIVEGS